MDVGIDTTAIAVYAGMVVVVLGLILVGMSRPRPVSPPPRRSRRWALVDVASLTCFIGLPLTGDIWLRLLIGLAVAGALSGIGETLAWKRRTRGDAAR